MRNAINPNYHMWDEAVFTMLDASFAALIHENHGVLIFCPTDDKWQPIWIPGKHLDKILQIYLTK